jgi:hypothetical protein
MEQRWGMNEEVWIRRGDRHTVLLFGDGELSNREKALVVLARPCRNNDAPASGRSALVEPLHAARGQADAVGSI